MNADPLAALKPLHLPQPIGWWPPAPGWWILAAIVLVALVALTLLLLRWWRGTAYRRYARHQLRLIHRQTTDDNEFAGFAAQASQILRRAALARYPREQVAALCHDNWLGFLDRTGRTTAFSQGAGRALVDAAYRPSARGDTSALYRLCVDWLRRHR